MLQDDTLSTERTLLSRPDPSDDTLPAKEMTAIGRRRTPPFLETEDTFPVGVVLGAEPREVERRQVEFLAWSRFARFVRQDRLDLGFFPVGPQLFLVLSACRRP